MYVCMCIYIISLDFGNIYINIGTHYLRGQKLKIILLRMKKWHSIKFLSNAYDAGMCAF